MSDQQNDKPKKVATPEEKAAAAAAAKAASEERRKAKEAAVQEKLEKEPVLKEAEVPMESTGDSSASTTEVSPTEKRKPTPEEKAAAAATAKAAAEERRKAKEAAANGTASSDTEVKTEEAPKEKRQFTPEEKAAAAAAAKAAAEERRKAKEAATEAGTDGATDDEKAVAVAKAKAAAAAKAKAAAAVKAKAATSENAGAEVADSAEEAAPKEPSKNQPALDAMVIAITTKFGSDVIEDSYINMNSKEDPTLIIKNANWFEVATFLKEDPELALTYLSNVTGVDYEEHMEVVYYLQSFSKGHSVMVKVKADREQATIASVTPIWAGANWNEREIYDLLGINFPGHPNHVRIMMTDDWVGHPLRKDYEPLDKEV